jgi:alpha-L-rhamnosidase
MQFAKVTRIIGCCGCLALGAAGSVFAGILPVQLQCESKVNPVGLSETSPRLSWQVETTLAGERGQYQSAYQIQVASSPQLLAANQGDLWDAGQVATNQAAQIAYGGVTLASHQLCYWHVRVWDKNGQASDWSPPASWSMGLLNQGDWTAQWIGRDDAPAWRTGSTLPQANWLWFPEGNPASSAPVTTRWFRKVFTVPTGVSVTQAIATMTADNSFTLYVNGQIALSGDNWKEYAQADFASFLVNGTNVLAVAAVNGGTSPSPAGFIGAFDLAYSNGQTNSLQTDDTWLSANQFYSNWNQTNFVASGWSNSMVLGSYGISPWNSFINNYLAATQVRKDFSLSQLPARAVLYVTGQGLVEPHLNGMKVGNDYFVPGWTDYKQRLYYQAYDVSALLQPGANTLGGILGDGWYRGNCAFNGQNFYGTKTRLRAQLHLFYTNGTTQVIASDSSWKAGFGPLRESDNQAGETYDARLEVPGWDSPGFSNGSWSAATTGAEISPTIQASPAEPVQAHQNLVPVAITQPQPGLYVLNFGQNIAGWVRLQVTNQPAGRRIVMRFGEWLNPDGTVFRDNLRSARAMDTYICKGGGVETWEPRFTYHGFQYMEVQGLAQPPTTNTFTAVVVGSGLADAGAFQCSNDQINRIYSNMLWSVRGNYFSVPTDCPQRDERAGWCDGTEVMRTGMFNEQAESFFSKWCQDIVDTKARATSSDFGQQAPLVGDFGFSAGWQDSVVFVPYWVYQTYGDLRPAQRFYTNMTSHLAYYASLSSNFVGPNSGYGDWVAVDGSTPLNLVSTAFYGRCASMMAEMAQALGKTADAVTYRQLFTNICAAFQANFVKTDGTVGSGSEGGYALALGFNLLTPAQSALAANKMAAAVNAQNGHPSTGMVTTYLLLPALTSIARSDLAYQMLAKTDYPSWGYEIGLGATTIFELWNSVNADGFVNTSQDGMNSLNHANFGACAEWFYRGILGIDLMRPGFSQILIAPQIGGDLTWARGSYDSIQGRITSSWGITNSTLTLNVTIPANATAVVNLPTLGTPLTNLVIRESGTVILQNGAATGAMPGVTFDHVAGAGAQSYCIWNVPAGTYQFDSTVQQTPAGFTAQAGNGFVQLNWNVAIGSAGYNVKRSQVSGGPYMPLANGLSRTTYTDFAVTNGSTYYYVVSATNAAGESLNSAEVAATPQGIANFGFESPAVSSYQYLPAGAGWTFGGTNGGGGAGITANHSGFTTYNAPAPEGVQVAFVQNFGTIVQPLTGFTPGTTYTITFSAAQRADSGNQHGGESWNVTLDGNVIRSYNPGASATSYVNYTASFVATATTHTLGFVGTDLATGDNTVFIDNVRISPPNQFKVPATTLAAPTNNARYTAPAAVNLAALVTPNGNTINNVQFYSNATDLIAQVTAAPYTSVWTNVAAGNYTINARVVFNGGLALDSPAANILVANSPPVIQSVGFNSGGFFLGGNIQGGSTLVLMAASNLVPPVAWFPVATNQSDTNHGFSFTNLSSPNPQQFFRILMP